MLIKIRLTDNEEHGYTWSILAERDDLLNGKELLELKEMIVHYRQNTADWNYDEIDQIAEKYLRKIGFRVLEVYEGCMVFGVMF